MPFSIIRQDITRMRVDAIVNAANTALVMGGGVCGAIFAAAGERSMQEACDALAPIQTGEAVVTPAFALPCRYVIHAAGPVYCERDAKGSEALLARTYRSALACASALSLGSVAFPLISSGIYGFPKADALRVACDTIRRFLEDNEMQITLVVFDRDSFVLSEALQGQIARYIDETYAFAHSLRRRTLLPVESAALHDAGRDSADPHDLCASYHIPTPPSDERRRRLLSAPQAEALDVADSVEERIAALDESFSEALFRLIDARGLTDAAVYKRANLDRKLFSKIRSARGYMPSKRTALALAVALRLDLNETDDLLRRAGYALSHSRMFDVIVEFFILNKRYDIFEINETLFRYDQPLLGG